MTKLFGFINKLIFAPILNFFLDITGGNYALSIFLFTLALNIVLIPLTVKGQKSAVGQFKIKPKLDELKAKCGDDKQKYNQGMQKIYQDNNISMGGGCLPMILRLVLVMSVYYLVTLPLTYFTELDANVIEKAFTDLGYTAKDTYRELFVISDAAAKGSGDIFNALGKFDFKFFGIDLTAKPDFTLNFSKPGVDFKLWIIPFLSFASALASGIYSSIHQKRANPDAPNMMGMMLMMPLFSLWIAFNAPCGLGFYWACSSLIGTVIQVFINRFFSPAKLVAKEQAKFIVKRSAEEKKFASSKAAK